MVRYEAGRMEKKTFEECFGGASVGDGVVH